MRHKHLEDSHESYFSHLKWAVASGFQLIGAGLASILHGIYPSFFPFKAAKVVIDLYYKRLHRHPNKEYRSYVEKVKKENEV
jgi:hypothetical protein